jgi:hypothetical protein
VEMQIGETANRRNISYRAIQTSERSQWAKRAVEGTVTRVTLRRCARLSRTPPPKHVT